MGQQAQESMAAPLQTCSGRVQGRPAIEEGAFHAGEALIRLHGGLGARQYRSAQTASGLRAVFCCDATWVLLDEQAGPR